MSDLWGRLDFNGTPGAAMVAADIGATLVDGGGTGVYGADGDELVTHGQRRFKNTLTVPPDDEGGYPPGALPTPAHVWATVRRASGIVGDNTGGTPSTTTNILELNATSNTPQIAVAIRNDGKASLMAGTGTAGSNQQGTRTIYNDGNYYDFTVDCNQAGTAVLKVQAGPGHPDFVEGFTLDDLLMPNIGVGQSAIIEGRGGSMATGATAHIQRIDRFQISDTPIIIADPGGGTGDADLQHAATMPTETGFVLSVKVSAGDAYRVVATDVLAGSSETTDWVTPIGSGAAHGYAKLEYAGGSPWRQYQWQVQTRIDGLPVDVGQAHFARTLPAKGEPLPEDVKIFLRGCQQANNTDYYAHDDAEAWGPHFGIHFGDFDYANNATLTLAAQIGHLETQQAVVTRQRQHMRDIPGFIERSDHDGEGHNDVYGQMLIPGGGGATYGDVSRLSMPAFTTMFGFPVEMPLDDEMLFRFWVGQYQFICWDFRGPYRTDPNAVSTDNGPDAGPDGMCGSAAQEAQAIAWLRDPDAKFTFFVSDPPWSGDFSTDDKGDTWRCYRAQRARIGAVMTEVGADKGMILAGDLHGVGASSGGSLNSAGGWPVTHNCGIRSGSDEANRIHNGDYDSDGNQIADLWDGGYWPPPGYHGKIACYGRLTLSNNAVTWVGRALAPGVEDQSPAALTILLGEADVVTDGWSVGLPDIPGSQLDISTYAVNVQNRDAGWRFPPRRGENLVVPTANGRLWNAQKPYDEGTLTLSMYALGSNPDGSVPANRVTQVLTNLAELDRFFTGANLLEVWRRDGPNIRRCFAEVVDAFDLNSHGGEVWGDFVVVMRRPQPFFEDLDVIEQTIDFDPGDDHAQVLLFSAFAGGTAPIDDAVITVNGSMPSPKLSDANSFGYVQYIGNLGNVAQWEIDNLNFTSRLINADTDAIGQTARYGSGAFLTLYPRHVDGMVAIRVVCDGAPGGQASVKVAARRKFVRA